MKGTKMNLKQINEFRASQGLSPVTGDPRKQERATALERNRRAKAQANRDMKAARAKR